MDCIAGLPGVDEVILVHVIPSSSHIAIKSDLHSQAYEHIESDRMTLEQLGLLKTKAFVLESDDVARSIEETAQAHESSIIVMGARGKGLIKGLHLGSVTNRVLHISKKNLLIMRGQIIEKLSGEKFQKFCPMIFSKILIPVDLTIESWDAAQKVAQIPDVQEIIVGYVIARGETEREVERQYKEADTKLKEHCSHITTKAEIRWRILEGDLVSRINEYAEEADVSLVCTTPTEKGFFAEILHGSFSSELARLASRPVLVIRRQK